MTRFFQPAKIHFSDGKNHYLDIFLTEKIGDATLFLSTKTPAEALKQQQGRVETQNYASLPCKQRVTLHLAGNLPGVHIVQKTIRRDECRQQ